MTSFFDHLDALCFQVAPVRGRQAELAARREDDLAFPPRLGMDDEREALPAVPPEERFEPAVMIGVPV